MATGTIKNDIVLLWTNPNPTASFAEQDINLDLSDYRFIEITALYVPVTRVEVGGGASAMQWFVGSTSTTMGTIANARRVYAYSNKVHFMNNEQVYTGSASTVVNTNTIPLKIYGIK